MSDTLRVGSFISTILVIAIHYNSKSLISIEEGYNINYYIQEFITGGVARIAVPYFALLSGYFASSSRLQGDGYLCFIKKKTKTLLIPYFIAAYFIFYSSSLIEILLGDANALSLSQIISYSKSIWTHPSEQLWYMRDLLFLTALTPLLVSSPRFIRYFLVILLGGLWFFEKQVFPIIQGWYLLNMETLFFFFLGGIITEINPVWLRIVLKRKRLLFLIFLWCLITVLRMILKPDFFLWYSDRYTLLTLILFKSSIIIGIPVLFSLSYQLRNKKYLIYLSGLNFFVYLYHFFPLFYFRRLTGLIIPGDVSFYFDFPLAVFITYSLGFFLYTHCPLALNIIAGSRIPSRRKIHYAAS